MGGLPRRATFIRREIADGIPTLLLESGGFASNQALTGAPLVNAARKSELVIRILADMGYQAIALGETDLYLGRETLEKAMKAAGGRIAFLSANLKDADGKLVYPGSTVLKVGGLKVGVVGLTSRELDFNFLSRRFPGVFLEDPIQAAAAEVSKLRKNCDLVIALTHLGFGLDRELAGKVPGIDIIIGGRSSTWLSPPALVDGVIVCNGYFEGRAVGRLKLASVPRRGQWVSGTVIDTLARQVAVVRPAALPKADADALAEVKRQHAEALAGDRFDGLLLDMDDKIPDDPGVVKAVGSYRKGLADEASRASPVTVSEAENPEHYTGSAICRDCHRPRYLFWQKTFHAHAFSTLEERGAGGDPDCLPCHTTGYLRPTGYAPVTPRSYLRGVGCEACHGVGSLHGAAPELRRLLRTPPASVCLACHIPGHDDNFNYGKSRKLVCGEAF